jgi:hypothetical protein
MHRSLWLACFAAAALCAPAVQAQQPSADEAAVRAAVEKYLEAHATGSGEPLKGVFHPALQLMFVREGAFATRSGEEYVAGFRGTPAADEAQRRRWIEMVDVAGNAAVAKVILDYPAARFTDYFTLLRVDGRWQIMNKTFHAEPKTAR